MNVQALPALSAEEQARRRKLVSGADWSCRMEGLGKPPAERVALDELWITGQITKDEHSRRVAAQVKDYLARRGH